MSPRLTTRFAAQRHLSTTAPLNELITGFTPSPGNKLSGTISPHWLQGTSTFGGCSAALCLLGARHLLAEENLLPLRSAQVTFMGAAGGQVSVGGEILRRGKSSAFVQSAVRSDDTAAGLATLSTFVFGKARASSVNASYVPTPPDSLPPAEACPTIADTLASTFPGFAPTFLDNFEIRVAQRGRINAAPEASVNWYYVRHKLGSDAGGVDGVPLEVSLLALADVPPPALLLLLPKTDKAAPNVSSLTWQVDVLDELDARPSTPGGWWLLSGCTENARFGYSAASMTLWGARDDWERGPLLAARQTIAVYL